MKETVEKISNGINAIGYFDLLAGTSQATRLLLDGIRQSGLKFQKIDPHSPPKQGLFNFSILNFNANSIGEAVRMMGGDTFLNNGYAAGYWFWELPQFPSNYVRSFNYINELWVASDFCAETFKKHSPPDMKVLKMPLPLWELSKGLGGELAKKKGNSGFTFLFAFDCHSYFERKNPVAVIRAFNKAFSKNESVTLVIKTTNLYFYPEHRKTLYDAVKSDGRIKIIENTLSKQEMNKLMNDCDCYISLHRSEGLGLTMAEAMIHGKPCIATNYSGNLEFMNKDNSFLVNYELVELERSIGVYEKGGVWAEPSIDEASHYMRHVFQNRREAKQLGTKAREYLKNNFSAERTGAAIKSRLKEIKQL